MENKVKEDSLKTYEEMWRTAVTDGSREEFWLNEAQEISWIKSPIKGEELDRSNPPFYRWFKNSSLNMCYNCVDRHIEAGKGETIAMINESAYIPEAKQFTYNQLSQNVDKFAKILQEYNLKKGDRAIIYMPMIPEIVFAMLACARIGVIHSVVFGGFASGELADRIKDAQPKILITASLGIEPRKKIPYYPIVMEALEKAEYQDLTVLLLQRVEFPIEKNLNKNTHVLNDLLEKVPNDTVVKIEEISGSDPLYILYTSGTTGTPKGVVRDTGGTAVALNFTMKNIMDISHKDVVLSSSDIGWVVGHTFMVYGPLLRGATTVIFEGKPVGTPDCGKLWELVQKYNVKALYTSPTALRAVKGEDFDYKVMKKYDLSSLKSVHMAGERCDPDTNIWLQGGIGEDKLINDQWWQTESGWPICCNNLKIHRFKTIPGSATRPQPGYNIDIVKSDGTIASPLQFGKINIQLPMPPSFMLTLWGNDEVFKSKYISPDNKYYITGDCGYFDEDGNIFVMSREDDMIKVAGHRLSTGRMEEVLTKIPEIAEAAVVAMKDDLKAEIPFAFIIVRKDIDINSKEVTDKILNHAKDQIVKEIGAISRLKGAVICQRLPKTRSGKIIRALLKSIINKEEFSVPPTIEDASVIDEVIALLKENKVI